LLAVVGSLVAYAPGDDRATGYLYAEAEQDWPQVLAAPGTALLDDLETLLGVQFPIVAFQGYRNGSGCQWHSDDPFDVQAILSLGVTRMFGVRRRDHSDLAWMRVAHGDLVVMPSGFQDDWQHCVPTEAVAGERYSLVFRTVRR
jgi:alkylated DNA repair dioxygenase AlkB